MASRILKLHYPATTTASPTLLAVGLALSMIALNAAPAAKQPASLSSRSSSFPATVGAAQAPTSSALAIDSSTTSPTLSGRDPAWAVPLNRPGLPNLFKVSDNLYRGAQPTAEGFRELKKMGVKTVINLRALHSDRDLLADTGLRYVHIGSNAWHAEEEDVAEFLKTVRNGDNGPFFVHCQHGSDRTGTMCAVYRIVIQGWTKERAIDEMTNGGYGFHPIWQNLVHYIQNLDIKKIRAKAGIEK